MYLLILESGSTYLTDSLTEEEFNYYGSGVITIMFDLIHKKEYCDGVWCDIEPWKRD